MDVTHFDIFSTVLIASAMKLDSDSGFDAQLNEPRPNPLSEAHFIAMAMRTDQFSDQVFVFMIFSSLQFRFGSGVFCYCDWWRQNVHLLSWR